MPASLGGSVVDPPHVADSSPAKIANFENALMEGSARTPE
jgi:hypothetical protein